MLKTHMAACLLASTFIAAPALAQTSTTAPATNTAPVTTPAGPAGSTMGTNPNTATGTTAGSAGTAVGGAPGTVTASGMGANMNFIPRRDPGVMRASELIGKDVYGANNEDIGEVDDVLINPNGQVIGVIVGVGGFLGIGETNVAVPMNALQFKPREANRGTAGTAATTGTAGTGTTAPGAAGTAAGAGTTASGSAGTGTMGTAGTTAGGAGAANNADVIVLMVTKEQLNAAPKFQDDARGRRNATTGGANTGTAPATGTGTAPRQ